MLEKKQQLDSEKKFTGDTFTGRCTVSHLTTNIVINIKPSLYTQRETQVEVFFSHIIQLNF